MATGIGHQVFGLAALHSLAKLIYLVEEG